MPTTYAIPDGRVAMAATTYTGNGANGRTVTTGFRPDFVWVKSRSTVADNILGNTLTLDGINQPILLSSNLTNAEFPNGYIGSTSQWTSNSFTVNGDTRTNANGTTYVAWTWLGGNTNGSGVTNTAGSITSQVSANTTAGFSIVTYTGTGANATVGHGLGVAPSFMIIKSRTQNAIDWPTYHISTGNNGGCTLNETAAKVTNAGWYNNTTPTSTVFSVGSAAQTNGNTQSMVAYCFAAVPGYSAFGSYTGNGSTNGPFVYLGFRPRFVMMKRADTTGSWIVWDTARNTYNQAQNYLLANSSNAEANNGGGAGSWNVDVLSNGFKVRSDSAAEQINASGGTYIYMAFAENPLKYSLAR